MVLNLLEVTLYEIALIHLQGKLQHNERAVSFVLIPDICRASSEDSDRHGMEKNVVKWYDAKSRRMCQTQLPLTEEFQKFKHESSEQTPGCGDVRVILCK